MTSAESQDGSEIVLNGVLASRVCPHSGLLRHTFGKAQGAVLIKTRKDIARLPAAAISAAAVK